MLAVGCAITINAPFFPRVVGLIVPASLLGALAFERVYVPARDALLAQGDALARLAPAAAIAALLAATALSSWRWYAAAYGEWATNTARLGRYLAAHPGFHARSVASDWAPPIRDVEFLAPGALIEDVSEAAVVKGQFDRSLALVLSPTKTAALAALHQQFPNGIFVTAPGNDPGDTAFVLFLAR
jgi:hypothetical protein